MKNSQQKNVIEIYFRNLNLDSKQIFSETVYFIFGLFISSCYEIYFGKINFVSVFLFRNKS